MGVKGLFQLLDGIQKTKHIKDFKGQTLGVDAYGWLHRGIFSCATELAQGRPTNAYVKYAMNRVRMLLHFGVTPYIVFDGDYLPNKAGVEASRAQKREQSKKEGFRLLQAGKSQQATLEFRKSIDVTPLMARELIEELKTAGVNYIVAPYEADSQLAYLEQQGLISGIISEDSDLLVFGASRLITKLDEYGSCVMIRRQDFTQCKAVSLINWSDKEFRMMAILNGCDYLSGINGLGLKTAHRLIRRYKNIDQVIRNLQFDGKMKVPDGFANAFHQADHTFLYQWVYCPNVRSLVNLTPLPSNLSTEDMPYIGSFVQPEIAQGVARGDLHPNTKQQLKAPLKHWSHQNKRQSLPETPDLKAKKPISDYFKRTPLAELDPNAFTPSPSQRTLLASQLNRSWSASGTDSARSSLGLSRRVSAPITTPRSLGPPRTSLGARQSSPHHKRLCADVLAEMEGGTLATTTSHYFSASSVGASATKPVHKKAKDEFELFSDDSVIAGMQSTATAVEQSLSQQSGMTTSPKKRKRMEVHRDPAELDTNGSQHVEQPLSGVPSAAATYARFSDSEDDTTTGLASQKTSQTPSQHRASLSSFRFAPSLDSQELTTSFAFSRARPSLAAAQYIHTTSKATLAIDVPAPAAEEEDAHPLNDTDCCTNEEDVLSSPLPVSPVFQTSTLGTAFGSEDILIPQSPSSTEDDGRLRPKLDLGRFAFAA